MVSPSWMRPLRVAVYYVYKHASSPSITPHSLSHTPFSLPSIPPSFLPASPDSLLAFFPFLPPCPHQIETCPCGHEAQMWEKVLGGESGERYLCFTKEDKVSSPANTCTFRHTHTAFRSACTRVHVHVHTECVLCIAMHKEAKAFQSSCSWNSNSRSLGS